MADLIIYTNNDLDNDKTGFLPITINILQLSPEIQNNKWNLTIKRNDVQIAQNDINYPGIINIPYSFWKWCL